VLSSPFPKGNTLGDGGRAGAREFGLAVQQGVIPGSQSCIAARLQVASSTQRGDDPPVDLQEYRGHGSITGRLALDKARLEARLGAIEIDVLKKDTMKIDMQIEGATEALDKRHRPRLDLLQCGATLDRLLDVILRDCGANDRVDLCGQGL
jgi:hypothetical protein